MTEEEREAADPWMTLVEIADELRVNPATVRLWVSKGQLKASRAGVRKLIVRRSDLAQMLAATNPSPEEMLQRPSTTEPPAPRRRDIEDSGEDEEVAPRFPPPVGTRESVRALMEMASKSIDRSLTASALAPPSTGYVDRLRAIADAFEHFAATSIHAGNTAGATWGGRDDWTPERLPYEVRPGGNRPRREGLWNKFDAANEALGIAVSGHDIIAVGEAFREAGDELLRVANQLAEADGRQADMSAV